jgi:hypothetical protein
MGNPGEVENGEENAGYVATETLENPPPYSSGKFRLKREKAKASAS